MNAGNARGEHNIKCWLECMHERECKGCMSFNRGVSEFNRGVNELNRGVNELNRGVNHSVARQGCNLLRAAVTSAVTSQGCCCGNLQIHPLDLGQGPQTHGQWELSQPLFQSLGSALGSAWYSSGTPRIYCNDQQHLST